MTDIEQKIRVIRDEARTETPFASEWAIQNLTLRRAIEQHEAFRQEVSDALKGQFIGGIPDKVARFIIAEPDPLVEVMKDMRAGLTPYINSEVYADHLRAAIEKRGGKIVWGEG